MKNNLSVKYEAEILSWFSQPGFGRITEKEVASRIEDSNLFHLIDSNKKNKDYYIKEALTSLRLKGFLWYKGSTVEFIITVYGKHIANCNKSLGNIPSLQNSKYIVGPSIGVYKSEASDRLLKENFRIEPRLMTDYCVILEEFESFCSRSEMKTAHKFASYKTRLRNLSLPVSKF